jgi:hypothetical protein
MVSWMVGGSRTGGVNSSDDDKAGKRITSGLGAVGVSTRKVL